MTERERYLKLATWSLSGQQKKIVRMELEAHIEHKVWKYQMRGYDQTQALEKRRSATCVFLRLAHGSSA